jgi:hypothetical protein
VNGARALTLNERSTVAPAPPASCPFGHTLAGPGKTVTGWQPCTCAGASSEQGTMPHQPRACPTCQSSHRYKIRAANIHGHYTWLCRACLVQDNTEAVYYSPRHIPAPDPDPEADFGTEPDVTAKVAGQWIITTGRAPQAFSYYLL